MAITKNGNEIDLHSFKDKPFGEFGKYVRKNIDPDWGSGKVPEIHNYEVCFTGTATVTQTVKVQALSEFEAEKLAHENIDCFGWDVDEVDIDSDGTEITDMDEDEE